MSIERRAMSALKWATAAKVVVQIASWTGTLLVVRLLSPEDYGLMAKVAVVCAITGAVAELDWDSNQTPVLVDYATPSGTDRRVLWANRNGFYYVLDRTSGKLVTGRPFVAQNWAEGLDASGRPILKQHLVRSDSLVYPSGTGATNWWSPTYDPALDAFFVPVLEQGAVLVPASKYAPVEAPRPFYTGVRALNAKTGAMLWEHRHEPRVTDNLTAGLLSTRSGVLFGGDLSSFFALDARTGRRLFAFETGARIAAAPITYTFEGRQHVSVISGRNLLTFALPREPGSDDRRTGAGTR